MARKHHYKRNKTNTYEIDVTTFLNLMVVLIPFLLITAVFSRLTIVELDLPSNASGAAQQESFRVEVIVREPGIEISNGTAIIATVPKKDGDYDLESLSEMMVALKQEYPDIDSASVLMEAFIPYEAIRVVLRYRHRRGAMRNSRRIKRMGRNRMKISKMNLTSLMDVFTILVFFLLVNSGSVEVLDTPKEVSLPESRVETKPRETVVIFISPTEVLVQGQLVALVDEIIEDKTSVLDPIAARLAQLKENVIGTSTLAVSASQEVTILADKSVPFMVIKTIMSTCTSEGFENVSLAVTQKAGAQVASN